MKAFTCSYCICIIFIRLQPGTHNWQTTIKTGFKMERKALAQVLRRAKPFFLIAGPCVLESESVVMDIATRCVETLLLLLLVHRNAVAHSLTRSHPLAHTLAASLPSSASSRSP